MPKYYFELKNGHSLRDPSGLDCEDDIDAVAKGKIIADHVAKAVTPANRKVAVHREDGVTVSELPIRRD